MITDVHAHYFPRLYIELLARITERTGQEFGRAVRTDEPADIVQRLQRMDDAGVQRQVLSCVSVSPYAEDEADAVEAARACNDSFNDLVQRYPDRFSAFVSLPLPHIEASLRELQRGFDQLGMVGVTLSCSVFNRSVAEAEFEPLYEEMNRRAAVLFFHPCQNGICSPFINDYRFTVSVGASLEDSAIVLHLIASQVAVRYPKIRFIVPHFGGIIPMLLQRLDNQAPSQHPNLPEPPSVTARRLYYDTVGHGSQAALLCAWQAFGADHLVTGSDYPVLLPYESYRQTFAYIAESTLPVDDVEKILHRNAASLFSFAN